jgi:Ca-activated chloride channel homolog
LKENTMRPPLVAGLIAFVSLFVAPAIAEERAIIVLDASGSMWGQIDGKAKISIAREVLGGVLGNVPANTSIGLMAYGHREKGNCADIELLIAPASGTAAAIVGVANALSPKGKTPLSDAVRYAAEALKYSENKANVILITDGLETCNMDPCAVARDLEATGVDFTAHVVGFGLSAEEGRQVACLADETGGKYIPAANAGALIDALSETVADVAELPPPPVEEEAAAEAVLPEATLDAPDRIEIGQSFVVAWEGPGTKQDKITLFAPLGDNGEGKDLRSRRVASADFDKRQVRLVAPVTPGDYELHYRYGRQGAVIATRAIAVVEASVSLSAPANADIGSTVVVNWVGPGGARDVIELFNPMAKNGEGAVLSARRLRGDDFENRKVSIVVPTEPGFYRLRYFNRDDRKVLASREIEVLAMDVSVSAAESVDFGQTFTVTWVGPGTRLDAIEIYDPNGSGGEGRSVERKRLVNGDFDGRSIDLIVPAIAGEYQIRYWSGEDRVALASRPISIIETEVSITAPDAVAAGEEFTVGWIGPGARRDSIDVVMEDAADGRALTSKRLVNGEFGDRRVTLEAPQESGRYLLRYWNGNSKVTLATRLITVE